MQIARAAGAQVLADLATPAPAETAHPDPKTPLPPRRTIDPGLLFVRVSRAVRQAIALEARIAAGQFTAARCTRAPDPRRAALRQAVHDATAHHPDRAELRRETDERLDLELGLNPSTPIADILDAICKDFGIHIDFAHLSDDILGLPSGDPATASQTPWRPPPDLAAAWPPFTGPTQKPQLGPPPDPG